MLLEAKAVLQVRVRGAGASQTRNGHFLALRYITPCDQLHGRDGMRITHSRPRSLSRIHSGNEFNKGPEQLLFGVTLSTMGRPLPISAR